MARERAAHFGENGALSHTAVLPTAISSVVVTTTAGDVVSPEHGTLSAEDEQELRTKPRGFFADQFEVLISSFALGSSRIDNHLQNLSNYSAHYEGTGPEIWRQTSGTIDAFVSGAGTGGTVAGIGQFLRARNREIRIAISDPEGSGLYNKVNSKLPQPLLAYTEFTKIKYGVMFDTKETEGTKRRHQVDTVVEGM